MAFYGNVMRSHLFSSVKIFRTFSGQRGKFADLKDTEYKDVLALRFWTIFNILKSVLRFTNTYSREFNREY